MEYLMTYGWAILIVSIVLASLWSLGVFSSNSTAGRAPTASCRVFRPGPSVSNTYISLLGVCTSEAPQYVAQFNGQSGYIMVPGTGILSQQMNSVSVTGWINSRDLSHRNVMVYKQNNDYEMDISSTQLLVTIGSSGSWIINPMTVNYNFNTNTWYFIAFTFNGYGATAYINGQYGTYFPSTFSIAPDANELDLGVWGSWNLCGGCLITNGIISNVQIYNTSLSASQISSLYAEGIGGVPTSLSNLVGWWPLNNDAKDYSGNNNNGAATSVSFMSSWTR
jgi:hypothetical protein